MKITLLFSVLLAGVTVAGCSHTSSSTNVARRGAPDGFQNPPAADPTVAADPTKPNSSANSALVTQNPPPAADAPQTAPVNTDQTSNVTSASPAAASIPAATASTTSNPAEASKSTDTTSVTASAATPNASYSGAKSDDNLNSTDAKAQTSSTSNTAAIPSATPLADTTRADIAIKDKSDDNPTDAKAHTSNTANTAAIPSTTTPADLATADVIAKSLNNTAADITVASTNSDDISARITEWRLGATEIQADLDSGVTLVRSKESVVGAPTGNNDDAVTTAAVKEKLAADSDAGKAMIDVEAANGEVTLKGTADSAAQVGRAMALALNTDGVTKVSADIKVGAKDDK